jgi:uncharacterized protein YciI
MALFVLACFDKPNSLDLRLATREAHLAYARENAAMIKVAGPMLDEAEGMAGSLFILDAPDRAAVEAFNAADPYQLAGLFGQVEIRGFRASIGQL